MAVQHVASSEGAQGDDVRSRDVHSAFSQKRAEHDHRIRIPCLTQHVDGNTFCQCTLVHCSATTRDANNTRRGVRRFWALAVVCIWGEGAARAAL